MSDVGDRIAADLPVAAGRRFLRRRLVRDVTLLVVGFLLLAAGIIGFAVIAHRSDELAATGVRATATAVLVDQGGSRFRLDEHVDVTFRAAGNRVIVARCYISTGDQYAVGGPVVIVYDPHDPSRAQLAGDPSLGPIGFPFLAAIVLGILLIAPTVRNLLHRRGMAAALRTSGQDTVARRSGRRITLRDAAELRVRGQVRGFAMETDTTARVFGAQAPGAMLVVVASTGAVVFGRVSHE
ncbi:MAG TPA: DUF3592 domain-containing protein [Pseudonocardiaceae bacterium]|nr:DUF3592 domain-containing protein [Pseudonocardiaceae bacterium]